MVCFSPVRFGVSIGDVSSNSPSMEQTADASCMYMPNLTEKTFVDQTHIQLTCQCRKNSFSIVSV